MSDDLTPLIDHWKHDAHGTYRSWFLWQERLKNFRSIRRGIAQVVRDIEAGTFGNAYRGSSLETVVSSVAEQRQIFKGADHAFLWKPKLRIPDIYENAEHQRAFGRLLHACDCCDDAQTVVDEIRRIDARAIKGLGPAVANLLYFIHPTFVLPFNTAIVRGYNALTGSNVKLGRWDHYLSMREGALRLNEAYRRQLSNDLGALAGLLFDVGSGRYPVHRAVGTPLSTRHGKRTLPRCAPSRQPRRKSGRQPATATPHTPRSRAGCATWARRWALMCGSPPTIGVAAMAMVSWETAAWMRCRSTAPPPATRCG